MDRNTLAALLAGMVAAAGAGCPGDDPGCTAEQAADCENAQAGRGVRERDAGERGDGGSDAEGEDDPRVDDAAAGERDAGERGDGGSDAGDAGDPLPDDLDLDACTIEGSAAGVPLGEPPRAYAGSDVTLAASDGCDPRLELAWYHGIPSDLSFYSSEREIVFRLFGRDRFELRASHGGEVRLTREIVIEATPTPIASSMLVEPIKPRSSQAAMATVSAIVNAMYVPITEIPSVASVDFELVALDERLRPAETVLSSPAQSSSVLAIPPLPVGWYEVRAIARGADGEIQSTPLPASFEVVP